jgi:GNAT superfamily N-acetyltransferase
MHKPFSDLALSLRLERAEGFACAQFAIARARLQPDSGAEAIDVAGTNVVFDGVDSPATQTFGFGLMEDATADALDMIEEFFKRRNAPVHHEVSPFAGVAALDLLCRRNYRPMEISSVLFQPIREPDVVKSDRISVRAISPEEAPLWAEINARGWSSDHPEMKDFLTGFSAMVAAREQTVSFLAELDGVPGAAGAMSVFEGVALFAGAATVPELRRNGLQAALLRERMRYAYDHGCDLAMIVTLPGSDSQRNAERNGFHIAYTRMKWLLCSEP